MKKITKLFFVFFIMISMTFFGCTSTPSPSETPDQAISENEAAEETDESKEESSEVIDNLTKLFSRTDNFMDRGLSYNQTMTMGDETTTMRIWLKGELNKTQSNMDGTETISINDFENGRYIIYFPDEKTGMVFTTTLDEYATDDDSWGSDSFDEQVDTEDFEFLGRETLNGEPCYVVITRDLETSENVKMWISETYGIPMRIEVKDVEYGEDFIIEVNNISVGVSDSEFEVPADIILQNMGQ